MKTFFWRRALTVALVLAATAGAQTVWDGETLDTVWYTKSASSASFKIGKASELAGLAYLVNSGRSMSGKTITLTGDVALNATDQEGWKTSGNVNPWVAIGTETKPFQGTFEGGGFTVRGVYISGGGDYQGLFGRVNRMAKINKLRVAESQISGNDWVGGLVGSDSGTITDCYSTATVEGGNYVGGLVGEMKIRGAITNSYATGEVSGKKWVGGLLGAGTCDTIRGGYAIGNVIGSDDYVGGLVGSSVGGYIINSYATGDVESVGSFVGGLAGISDSVMVKLVGNTITNYPANIVNCYAVGKVTGVSGVGGLVGRKKGGAIRNSYAAGAVSADGGGLVGETADNATITYGYYAIDAKDCDDDCDDGAEVAATKGLGIPKTGEDMRKEEFVSLLNVAAYALKNNTYRENTNKWYYLPGQYPKLSIDSVTAAIFASCFAKNDKGNYGVGTEADPYLIETRQHIENLAVFVNCGATQSGKFFKLKNDIMVADTTGWLGWNNTKGPVDGREWTPIGQQPSDTAGQPKVRFNGTFDGGGFVVGGVYVNKVLDSTFSGMYQGLFGRVEREGTAGGAIKNIGVVNSYINGYCYVGGLAGWNKKGSVTKCYARNVRIEAWGGRNGAGGIGGLVGINDSSGIVINSYAEDAYVSGEINMAGGLVGWNSANSRISYCHAKLSDVSITGDDVGGLVGRNDGLSVVRNSYANVDVFADGNHDGKGGNVIGGLVGMNFSATVAKCYASGTIRGNSSLGGLVGSKMSNGKVDSSYYRGDLTTIKNDYGEPKSEDDMKSVSTYKGWDFTNVWAIDDESWSYPYLGMRRAAKPVITRQPVGGDIKKDATFNLSVAASVSGGTISYQWYLNGVKKPDNKNGAIVNGARSASYTVPKEKTNQDTVLYYYVVVTNTSTAAVPDSLAGSKITSVTSVAAKVRVGAGAVQSSDREIPKLDSNKVTASISPVAALTAEFTAGPNPAAKSVGLVSFYRKGKRVSDGELRIYDVSGALVRKIRVVDGYGGLHKRKVGEWDLTDGKGREVSEGVYLVKGSVTADGKRERVQVIVGVVR